MRRNEPCKNCTEYWAPSQVYRETEGERLHDPDVWMIVAYFVQPPRQGRGPASGGEGTAERMCGVWGDATVACCRAVVRRLCGLCRGVCGRYLCASSPLDAIRAACGLKAKRRGVEGRSSIASAVWNGSLHRFDRVNRSCTLDSGLTLHGPPAGGRRVHSRPLGVPTRERNFGNNLPTRKSWVRTFRLRVVPSTMRIIKPSIRARRHIYRGLLRHR